MSWCTSCGEACDTEDICRTCGECEMCCECDLDLGSSAFDSDEFGEDPEAEFDRRFQK